MADAGEFEWYFGYGSNMNTTQLTAGKGVVPLESMPAKLEGWRLAFNMRVILKSMGSMANVVEDPKATVHGTLHKLTKDQLKQVDEFEGLGRVYKRVKVPVITYTGEKIEANVYTALPDWCAEADSSPSLRYKNILLDGARNGNIDAQYVQFLEAIQHIPFEYNKDRPTPPIPDKTFTREEVFKDKNLLTFMGVVFDVSDVHPMMKELLIRFGPPEWSFLRLMPSKNGAPKPVIPTKFADLSEEQLGFLDTGLHAMEVEWKIVGRCSLPVDNTCV